MRKDAGLELTDRIVVTLGREDADLTDHADWIKSETLAIEVFGRRRDDDRQALLGSPEKRESPPLRGVARGGLALTAHRGSRAVARRGLHRPVRATLQRSHGNVKRAVPPTGRAWRNSG